MRQLVALLLCFAVFPRTVPASSANVNPTMSWSDTKIDIASHVSNDFDFYRSVWIFRGKGQYFIDSNRYLKIEGDSTEDIGGYEVVHVLGNLNNSLVVEDQAEIVILKNVTKDATIYASGIQKIYVGGDFFGTIESSGSVFLIVKGNFYGTLTTGIPSTHVSIEQDYEGTVRPTTPGDSGLVNIHIMGTTQMDVIEPICSHEYSKVKITVGGLEKGKGIYPCGSSHRLVVEN